MGATLSERTRVRRLAQHQVHDPAAWRAVLEAGRVCHVGFVEAGQPFVVPLAYAIDDRAVLVHGSTGSRALRSLAAGAAACLTVTVLDGYVLARAAVEMSMRYRSAMVLGSFRTVHDPEAKTEALRRISDHSVPGRWAEIRPPTRRELASTLVLAMPVEEWSVKVNDGWPTDEGEDLDRRVWAGVLPLDTTVGQPLPSPDLPAQTPVPSYLADVPVPGRAQTGR